MPPLSDENKRWFENKLKGDFAENICNIHFSSLNYNVEKIGIENIAPKYTMNLHSFNRNNYVRNQINKTPDFIISKQDKDALFVEVKYNSTIDNLDQSFYDYGKDLMLKYKSILFKNEFQERISDDITTDGLKNLIIHNDVFNINTKVFFYILVPHKRYYNSYVFLFIPSKIDNRNWGWRAASNTGVDNYSGITGFYDRYNLIIEPFLSTLFHNEVL